MLGALTLAGSKPPAEFHTILKWADEIRKGKLNVRANADTGDDAANARSLGAEGIGLCRTEHMFFDPERIGAVRQMIMSADERGRRAALAHYDDRSHAPLQHGLPAQVDVEVERVSPLELILRSIGAGTRLVAATR